MIPFEECWDCHGGGEDDDGLPCERCDGTTALCVECALPHTQCRCEDYPEP